MSAPSNKSDLSKLTLPVAVVATLLGVALGAGVSYGAAKSELHAAAETAQEAKAEAQKAREDVHAHAVNLAVLNTQMADMRASLERIENALGTQPKGAK